MVFLTRHRLYLSLLILSGCSINSFENSYISANKKISFKTFEFNDLALDNKEPYAIFQINKNNQFFAEIKSVSGFQEKWQTSTGKVLTMQNNKIVKTSGLDNDFKIIFYSALSSLEGNYNGYIRFSNPDSGFLEIKSNFKRIENFSIKNNYKNVTMIEETFSVDSIGWSGQNYYWFDKDSKLIKSIQYINPYNEKIFFEIKK
jgi:hypothetical protein